MNTNKTTKRKFIKIMEESWKSENEELISLFNWVKENMTEEEINKTFIDLYSYFNITFDFEGFYNKYENAMGIFLEKRTNKNPYKYISEKNKENIYDSKTFKIYFVWEVMKEIIYWIKKGWMLKETEENKLYFEKKMKRNTVTIWESFDKYLLEVKFNENNFWKIKYEKNNKIPEFIKSILSNS